MNKSNYVLYKIVVHKHFEFSAIFNIFLELIQIS